MYLAGVTHRCHRNFLKLDFAGAPGQGNEKTGQNHNYNGAVCVVLLGFVFAAADLPNRRFLKNIRHRPAFNWFGSVVLRHSVPVCNSADTLLHRVFDASTRAHGGNGTPYLKFTSEIRLHGGFAGLLPELLALLARTSPSSRDVNRGTISKKSIRPAPFALATFDIGCRRSAHSPFRVDSSQRRYRKFAAPNVLWANRTNENAVNRSCVARLGVLVQTVLSSPAI